ncbi:hypothetical protein A3719_16130 [Erythrobacter sp. HI0020]|nr:hypothetical protein A3719_16130 [Erythrobacter sp. HI0020]
MGTAKDFDPVDRAELTQGASRTRAIDSIDKNRDRTFQTRVVADRADTANTRGTVSFVAGGRHQQGRCNLVQLTYVAGARILEGFSGNS